jgi:ribose/xylose/arabinose/galactoside ABC-type transport system permease subunit
VGLRLVQFLAIVLTALALVPAGAHLFELPNKVGLAEEAYFVVQGIYRGWALFGIVLFGALAANLALAVMVRRKRAPFRLASLAFLAVAATLAIFFTWTYPANLATRDWTVVPANWQELRTQWEYAHATNAVLTFLALCAVTWSVLLTRD